MRKRGFIAAAGFVAASICVSTPAPVAARQATGETAPTYLNAVVVSTDAAASTVTVRPKGRAAETLRLEGPLAARLGELKAGDEVIVTLQAGRVLELKKAIGTATGRARPPARRRRVAPASPATPVSPARPTRPVPPVNPPPGPLTPPGIPPVPTPPAPPTLYPGPPPSPARRSNRPGSTPSGSSASWPTPRTTSTTTSSRGSS